jgi:hypothetical protein
VATLALALLLDTATREPGVQIQTADGTLDGDFQPFLEQ